MFVMNNNSIHLRTKLDFCVLKFDISLVKTLISTFFGKISKMFSSSHLDLSFLGSRKNSNFISFSITHRGVETRLRLQDNFTYNLNIYFDQDVYFDQGKLQIQIFKLIRNT